MLFFKGKLANVGGYNDITSRLDEMAAEGEPEAEIPWAKWLPKIMFSMNNQVSKTTGYSPFELVFNQQVLGNIFPSARTGKFTTAVKL